MAYSNFVEALSEAKRRAQLQGRPVSEQEVRGITEGFASSQADKGLQEKSLGLQEQSLEASKSQFAENLAQRKYETEKQIEAADKARTAEKYKAIGTGVGTAAGAVGGFLGAGQIGAALGTTVAPGVGTVLGGLLGGALGGITGSLCIIISSCTSPDSYEVKIAREYRDKYMSEQMLTGYYFLCFKVVPYIQKYKLVKKLFKKILVDRLVDYGEWRMGYKPKRKYLTSMFITKAFLSSCYALGRGIDRILEVNHG